MTSDVDESVRQAEHPEDYARRMANEKAAAVVSKSPSDAVIIAADTLVLFNNTIMGKPDHRQEILPMLKMLNGKTHQVISAYQIRDMEDHRVLERTVKTDVSFYHVSEEILKAYAASEEPLDKAGAYSIQGLGTVLVKSIDGSYNNVVGLPIELLLQDLIAMEVISC